MHERLFQKGLSYYQPTTVRYHVITLCDTPPKRLCTCQNACNNIILAPHWPSVQYQEGAFSGIPMHSKNREREDYYCCHTHKATHQSTSVYSTYLSSIRNVFSFCPGPLRMWSLIGKRSSQRLSDSLYPTIDQRL